MKKHIIAGTMMTLFSVSAFAADSIRLEEQFAVDAGSSISFDIPVGSLELRTHSSNEIIIEVRVKEQENKWFSGDLEDVFIDKDISGHQVTLEIDAKDTIQEWEVYVPASAHLNIDLGVGEVELDDVSKDIYVDVGVGEVDINLASNDYDRIDLDSGVGATDLSGFRDADNKRRFISQTSSWRGNGQYRISVDVGVGDVDVNY